MINIYLLIQLLTVTISISQYARITDYRQYISKWAEMVPAHLIHDVSHMALQTESCYANRKCQFYYYEYIDSSITDPLKNRTLLFVSGMHGNQYLGPHTLLYAYKHLKAARIIYLPMANPSGFIRNQRLTFPFQIDPNRDYPIDGNFECYRASATHIIDSLFRKYQFDLTVVLHNGGSQIGFNWGTNTHQRDSHTQDYEIYYKIGKMMKKWGGKSKALGLDQFALGTMTEVIYPASGTFDDWAYAAGKFPSIITSCSNFNYKSYPQNMANGLLFLIQMGPFDAPQFGSEEGIDEDPLSDSKNNGYITRGIRMLKNLIQIIQPTVNLIKSQEKIGFQIHGCSSLRIYNLTLKVKQQNSTSQLQTIEVKQDIQFKGDISSQNYIFRNLVWLNSIAISQDGIVNFEGNLHCDPDWEGKGTTFFSKRRIYRFNSSVSTASTIQTLINGKDQSQLKFIKKTNLLIEDNIVVIICLAIIGIGITILLIYSIKKYKEQSKHIVPFEVEKQLNSHIQFTQKQIAPDVQPPSSRDILQN